MKQVNKRINEIFKSISGKVLCIGSFNDDALSILKENNNIIFCDLLNTNISGGIKGKGKSKTINMKDFKKHYKKNNLDYIMCNINDLKKYIPRFISTSIYIGSGKVFIYGKDEVYELERLSKKYKRYKFEIKKQEYEDSYILEIDVSNSKNNFFMDKVYYIIDTLGLIADKISDLIIS